MTGCSGCRLRTQSLRTLSEVVRASEPLMHMKLAYAFKHWFSTASVNGRLHDISNTQ